MKSASSELIAYLNSSQQFCMADLYTFTLVNGFVVRYNSSDIPLTVAGNTFALGPLLQRSRIACAVGLEVDTLDLSVTATSGQTLNGVPWLVAARTGVLDSASVRVERLFMPTWGDASLGTIVLFEGKISDIAIDNLTIQAKVKSDLELLNIKMPRNLFQPGCIHTLFDPGCTLLKSSFQVATTAAAGATSTSIPIAASNAANYFDLGTIEFTGGANAGLKRSVKLHTLHLVTVALAFPHAPANGDTCIITPGCDKLQATCSGKFSNLPNYRGYPYIPVAETAV